MHPDEARLLSAVAAEPDADEPRLVYADWLEEHDRPERARSIRQSVEAARLPAGDLRRSALFDEAERLLNEHFEAWEAAMPQLPGVAWGEYVRGFVIEAIASAGRLLPHGDAVFAAAPIRELNLALKTAADGAGLAAWPAMSRVRALTLDGPAPPRAFVGLFASPHLARLERLDFDHMTLRPAVLRATCDTANLPGLKTLYFYGTRLPSEALPRLAARLAGLTWLGMVGTGLGDAAAEAIAAHARGLTQLQLADNGITARGVAALCRTTEWADIEDLNIGQSERCGPMVAHAVAGATHWKNLRWLRLNGHGIDDAGVEALAASPVCAGLFGLSLSINRITDAGAVALARSPHLGRLCWLHLDSNPGIGPAGWAALRERFGDRV
jgi:uncharacterized protein (TIGR02996 family)